MVTASCLYVILELSVINYNVCEQKVIQVKYFALDALISRRCTRYKYMVTYYNAYFHHYRLDNLCIYRIVSQQQDILPKDTETDFEDTCSLFHLSCQGSLFFHHIEPCVLHTGRSGIGIRPKYSCTLKHPITLLSTKYMFCKLIKHIFALILLRWKHFQAKSNLQ